MSGEPVSPPQERAALLAALEQVKAERGKVDMADLAALLGLDAPTLLELMGTVGAFSFTVEGGQVLGMAQGATVTQTNHYAVNLPAGLTLLDAEKTMQARAALSLSAGCLEVALSEVKPWGDERAEEIKIEEAALSMADALLAAVQAGASTRDVNAALRRVAKPVLYISVNSGLPDAAESMKSSGVFLVVMALLLWSVQRQDYRWVPSALDTRIADSAGGEVALSMLRYMIREDRARDRWAYLRDTLLRGLPARFPAHDRLLHEYAAAEMLADAAFQTEQIRLLQPDRRPQQMPLGGTYQDQRRFQEYLRGFLQDEGGAVDRVSPGLVGSAWELETSTGIYNMRGRPFLGPRP